MTATTEPAPRHDATAPSVRAELLDCVQSNLAVLADRHHGPGSHLALGAVLRFTPRPGPDGLPTVEPSADSQLAAVADIGLTERILKEAHAKGQLGTSDLKQVLIGGRALVYGFARMAIDGHFARWGVAEAEVDRTAEAVLDLFISGIARRPGHS